MLVIEEFFQCYHLNDARSQFWSWLVEVVSSPGSISSEATERNNHFYFYEKTEMLIEACFILLKQSHLAMQAMQAMQAVPNEPNIA